MSVVSVEGGACVPRLTVKWRATPRPTHTEPCQPWGAAPSQTRRRASLELCGPLRCIELRACARAGNGFRLSS